MTCPFDRATLAEYANEDIPAALREATETHLQTCQACRLVVEQYQEGAEALAGAVAAVSLPAGLSQPLPGRRPAWPVWVTATGVTACLLLLFQIPAVAEKLRMIRVTFISLTQLEERIQATRNEKPDYGPPASLVTGEEAAQKYRRPVALPTYLPEGYKLRRVIAYGYNQFESLKQEYVVAEPNTSLLILQRPARAPGVITYLEGQQPIVVDINGVEGYVVEQVIMVRPDGTYAIKDDQRRSLLFEWNGDFVQLVSMVTHYPRTIEPLSTEELVKIARSIK